MPALLPSRSFSRHGTAYISIGEGEPLVLLHGVGLRLEAWEPQIARFSERCRVIALDLPGHGRSAPLTNPGPLEHFVRWLGETLPEIEPRPVNLAGHSMGALIALGHALASPRQVHRLCLLNAVSTRDPELSAAVRARSRAIANGAVDVDGPLARWFDPNADGAEARAREQARDWLSSVDRAGYAAAYQAFAEGDRVYAERAAELVCPALFLTGELDPNSTPAMSRALAAAAPRGRAVVIPGHRHLVALVAPQAVNTALARWLDEPAEAPVLSRA